MESKCLDATVCVHDVNPHILLMLKGTFSFEEPQVGEV